MKGKVVGRESGREEEEEEEERRQRKREGSRGEEGRRERRRRRRKREMYTEKAVCTKAWCICVNLSVRRHYPKHKAPYPSPTLLDSPIPLTHSARHCILSSPC